MSNGTLAISVALIVATILVRGNDHLRGLRTARLGLYLRAFIFGCFLAPILFGEWEVTLVLLASWLLLIQPIARRLGASLAVWAYRRAAGGSLETWIGLPHRKLARITQQLAATDLTSTTDMAAFLERGSQREKLRAAALDVALGQPEVQAVLRRFDASRTSVEGVFNELVATGVGQVVMGHYLPYSIAFYPRPLSVVLAWKAGVFEMSHIEMSSLMLDYFRFGRRLPQV